MINLRSGQRRPPAKVNSALLRCPDSGHWPCHPGIEAAVDGWITWYANFGALTDKATIVVCVENFLPGGAHLGGVRWVRNARTHHARTREAGGN